MNTTKTSQKHHLISYANGIVDFNGSMQEIKCNNTIEAKGKIECNNDIAMLLLLGHILDKGYSLKALRYNKPTGEISIVANKKKRNTLKINENNTTVTMQ